MKRRITMWAGVGFLVGFCWVLYTLVTPAEDLIVSLREPLVQALGYATCPIAFIAAHHFPLRFWWVPPINAATYALAGLLVEMLRRRPAARLAV